MKSVISTGEFVQEDVKDQLTCWTCEGMGYMAVRDPQDTEPVCLKCNGSGLNWK